MYFNAHICKTRRKNDKKKKKKICFGKNDIDVYKLMRVHLKQTCAYVNEKGIFKNKFREHTEQHINQGDLFTLRQAST